MTPSPMMLVLWSSLLSESWTFLDSSSCSSGGDPSHDFHTVENLGFVAFNMKYPGPNSLKTVSWETGWSKVATRTKKPLPFLFCREYFWEGNPARSSIKSFLGSDWLMLVYLRVSIPNWKKRGSLFRWVQSAILGLAGRLSGRETLPAICRGPALQRLP